MFVIRKLELKTGTSANQEGHSFNNCAQERGAGRRCDRCGKNACEGREKIYVVPIAVMLHVTIDFGTGFFAVCVELARRRSVPGTILWYCSPA
jgi:hypothetical protein